MSEARSKCKSHLIYVGRKLSPRMQMAYIALGSRCLRIGPDERHPRNALTPEGLRHRELLGLVHIPVLAGRVERMVRITASRTMDATDTAAPETRYCGRSQALLYNEVRPHSSLDYLTPNEFVAQAARPAPRNATGRGAAVDGASAPRPVAEPYRREQLQPVREAVSS